VPIEVTMPKLSPTMETGVIAQWLVKVGDKVKEGDVLADIETDKATMPMKSFDDGVIVHLDHAAGDEVSLGERVLVLARKNEDPKQVAEALGLGKAGGAGKAAAPAATAAAAPAAAGGARPSSDNGKQVATMTVKAPVVAVGGRVRATPLARKIATAAAVELAEIAGSGPGGRVVRRDVENYLKSRPQARPAAPAAQATPQPGDQRIPHSRMRKTIAQRMTAAKQTAPEIHVAVEARVDRLVAAREQLNNQLAKENIKLSLGDFVTKAVASALRLHPALNAVFEPDAIVRKGAINLGIAVALDEGLIVPVLAHADTLGLREIRIQTDALTKAARNGTLTTDQLTGGTFTISNMGMFGTRQFDAILNLPEVAILAVGAAEKRPVVVNDQLAVGTVMTLNLTADHRAVDGATAALFMQTLKLMLEEPAAMLL